MAEIIFSITYQYFSKLVIDRNIFLLNYQYFDELVIDNFVVELLVLWLICYWQNQYFIKGNI